MQPVSLPKTDQGPGVAGWWIGSLLLVGGIVFAVAMVAFGVGDVVKTVKDYQQISVQRGGVARLEASGTYTLYRRLPEVPYGPSTSVPGIFDEHAADHTSPVTITVSGPGGERIPFRAADQTTPTADGIYGRRLGSFHVDAPGNYAIHTSLASGDSGTGTILVVGKSPLRAAGRILWGLLLGALAGIAGIVVLIVTGVRRGRARRAANPLPPVPVWGGQPAWGGPPPGFGGPPPAWGGPPPGYGPPGYGGPAGYGAPPGYGPPPAGYGAPQPAPGPPGWAPPPGPAPQPPPQGWAPAPEPWRPEPQVLRRPQAAGNPWPPVAHPAEPAASPPPLHHDAPAPPADRPPPLPSPPPLPEPPGEPATAPAADPEADPSTDPTRPGGPG